MHSTGRVKIKLKLFLCIVKCHATREYRGVKIALFILQHGMEESGQLHTLVYLPPRLEPPGMQWNGDWIGPRTGLDDGENRRICCLEIKC